MRKNTIRHNRLFMPCSEQGGNEAIPVATLPCKYLAPFLNNISQMIRFFVPGKKISK